MSKNVRGFHYLGKNGNFVRKKGERNIKEAIQQFNIGLRQFGLKSLTHYIICHDLKVVAIETNK
jgi:hypothetical protein